MPDLDPILNRSINAMSNRLSEAQYAFLKNAGVTTAKLMSMSNEELRQLLYSGGILDITSSDLNSIRSELKTAHKQNANDIRTLARDVTNTVYSAGVFVAAAKGQTISAKKSYLAAVNPKLAGILHNYEIMANSSLNKRSPWANAYKKTINQFVSKIMSDDSEERISAPSAIRQAIRELTDKGICSVDYKSGRTQRMDSAVRRDIMAEFTNIVSEIQQKVADEVGFDAVEITVEYAPAEDHADVQGMVFTNEEYEKLQNHEPAADIDGNIHHLEKRAIGQYNCRHSALPFMI